MSIVDHDTSPPIFPDPYKRTVDKRPAKKPSAFEVMSMRAEKAEERLRKATEEIVRLKAKIHRLGAVMTAKPVRIGGGQ